MKTTLAPLLACIALIVSLCPSQAKTVSFQDLAGNAYTNLVVLTVEKDGVLFRVGEEFKYVRVKFTNMTEEVQVQCGYDAQKIQQQRGEKAEKERLAREKYFAEIKKMQAKEITGLSYLARPINTFAFPKTDSVRAACKELVAELKGVNTALELGVSFNKFSDLFTDTAIKIQKAQDLAKVEIPVDFQIRMDDCIEVYNKSRNEWRKSIEAQSDEVKGWRDYFRQKAWAESGIHLTMLLGIVDGRTNANELVIGQAVDLVEAEKLAFKNGILPSVLRSYPAISQLSEEEILKRLKAKLADDAPTSK